MQVQKAEGAFASPIEVQETAEFTLPPPSAEAQALPVCSSPLSANVPISKHNQEKCSGFCFVIVPPIKEHSDRFQVRAYKI